MTRKRLALYGLLIVVALFISLVLGAYSNLMRYRFGILVTDEPLSRSLLVATASVFDAGLMVVNAFGTTFDDVAIRTDSPLKDIRIRIEKNAIKKLVSNLPESGKAEYLKGIIQYPDGSWQKMSFRLRGRNIWHWFPDKPSLRLKLRRSQPLNLQRHINLVNPEDLTMIANYYGELLGQRLGVLTHKTEMVRLFVNNAFFGVYQMTTREDENMLRANARMPGPIYVGDQLEAVWAETQFEKKGELAVLESFDPMTSMIEAVNAPSTPDRYRKLWRFMDREKMARWIALLNLSGGIHTDYMHNHSYYFDPSNGKLEPLTSDLLALGALLYPGARDRLTKAYEPDHLLPINEKLHPLLDAALRDPHFYHLRNSILYQALTGMASTKNQHVMLAKIYDSIDDDVKADRRKAFAMELFSGFFRMPYSNRQYEEGKQEVFDWVAARNHFLVSELEKSDVRILLSDDGAGNTLARISVGGHAAVNIDVALFPAGSVNRDKNFKGGFEKVSSQGLRLFPGLKEVDDYYYEQVKDLRSPGHYLQPASQQYLFRFSNMSATQVERKLSKAFVNAISGRQLVPEAALVEQIDSDAIPYNTVSQHAWTFSSPNTEEIVLGPGILDISRNIESDLSQVIRILPSTTLRLAPGVSIISRGPLVMLGRKEEQIKVERLKPGVPWGVIAVQGKESSGSIIKHANISGGSVATALNIKYSGMVSFHWSDNVQILSSKIYGNTLGDDTLHIMHGDALLSEVELADCFRDCIDFDYAKAHVQKLRIRNAGNDALDFMSSQGHVSQADMVDIGDKGISGGEGSIITVEKTRIQQANIGVAAKDKSVLEIRNSHFIDNEIAVDTYKKNWRYGGSGRVSISMTKWSGNQVDIRVQDGGEVEVLDGAKPSILIREQGKITIH